MTRVGLVLVVLLALASISFNRRHTFELVDAAGAPIDLAYVAYSYQGSRPNFVHPVTYRASRLALSRSEERGRIVIPMAVHVHRPFPIETHPSLRVDFVYVPRLHNALATINPHVMSRPGIFELDAQRRATKLFDLSRDPQLWEGTLRSLVSIIHQLVATRPDERRLRQVDPESAALTLELIAHFRQEYDAFLARYRDVERRRPEMPDHVRYATAEEQRRWVEMIDAALAREPRWGGLITRIFEDDLRVLTQLEAELQ